MSVKFYYHSKGQQFGPFDADRMREMKRTGIIDSKTLVCPEGGTQWLAYTSYKELKELPAAPRPAKSVAKAQAAAAAAKAATPRQDVPPVALAMQILAGVVIAGGIAAAILAGRAHLGAFAVVAVSMASVITALCCYARGVELAWLYSIKQATEKQASGKE